MEAAIVDVQSDQGEGPVVLLAVRADVLALHEAEVDLPRDAADGRGVRGLVGVRAGPADVGEADRAVEISDG